MPRGPYKIATLEQRHKMWQLWSRKKNPLSYEAIGHQMDFSKSTVQKIITKVRKTGEFDKGKSPGRPSELSKRYVLCVFGQFNPIFYLFSWKLRLIKLAKKYPFWSCDKLVNEIFETMMNQYKTMEKGHQFQV